MPEAAEEPTTVAGAAQFLENDAFVEECTKALSQKLKPPKVGNEELYDSIRLLRNCLKSFMSRKDVFVSQCVAIEQDLHAKHEGLSLQCSSAEQGKKATEDLLSKREAEWQKKLEMAQARSPALC